MPSGCGRGPLATAARHADSEDMIVRTAIPAIRLLSMIIALLFFAIVARADEKSGKSVDLELVLAIDMSSTADARDFELQMRGFADAFRHPDVRAAVHNVGPDGIAVAMVQWSNTKTQELAMDWTLVTDEASLAALADTIETTPRFVPGGSTAIHSAMRFSIDRILDNGYAGRRKIIDISADGGAAYGPRPQRDRDAAIALGITVNGLVILEEDTSLDQYFKANVIGGPGSFVLTVSGYEDFASAMRKKLVLEIADASARRRGVN